MKYKVLQDAWVEYNDSALGLKTATVKKGEIIEGEISFKFIFNK